jgi:DNA-3-methyladenine glycosylase
VIEAEWLARSAVTVAPELIGCRLVRQWPDGSTTAGLIVETEAYMEGDPACHGYRRKTTRNAAMFGPAGRAYVYLIYGMYHCLNVVTDRDGMASAVLIRAVQLETVPPATDLSQVGAARKPDPRQAAGPGKLCRALQIDLTHTGQPLAWGQAFWLEVRSPHFQTQLDTGHSALVQTTRIGLTQGVDLPWRWYLHGCKAVSKVDPTAPQPAPAG